MGDLHLRLATSDAVRVRRPPSVTQQLGTSESRSLGALECRKYAGRRPSSAVRRPAARSL